MAKQICIIFTAGVALILLLAFVNTAAHSQQRFTDNGDGTITDHRLGLMWAKADNQRDIDWKEATIFVKDKFGTTTGRKYDNWRLPTLEELQRIIDDKDAQILLNIQRGRTALFVLIQ